MPTKKTTVTKSEPKTPKIPLPPIPEKMIYDLIDRYSVPSQSAPDDATTEIWSAVAELKGWMEKKGRNTVLGIPADPYNLRSVVWQKLRGILDDAVEENNSSAFSTLSKAWQDWNMSKPAPTTKSLRTKTIIDPWNKNEELKMRKVAETIESLTHPLPTNTPNSPTIIKFLKAILDLQRKWKRAPTRREIEDRTGISKKDVGEMAKDMGLGDLLSSPRSKRTP